MSEYGDVKKLRGERDALHAKTVAMGLELRRLAGEIAELGDVRARLAFAERELALLRDAVRATSPKTYAAIRQACPTDRENAGE